MGEKKMTREELLKRLRALEAEHGNDYEVIHQRADALLLEFIGDDEITAEFEALPKWYA